jgi:hypothetical protein
VHNPKQNAMKSSRNCIIYAYSVSAVGFGARKGPYKPVLLGKTACEDRDMPNPDRMGGF